MIIQVPTGLSVARQSFGQQRNDIEFRSQFGAQAVEVAGPLWVSSITAGIKRPGLWQALILQLRGKTNQLALWDMGRPLPLGTMRGAMTLGATAAGATALTITAAGEAGKSLLVGDRLGVGTGLTQQIVMVLADAVSNGSGVIVVSTEPPLRNAFNAGAIVTWNRPCALFRRRDSRAQWENEPGVVKGMMLDFIEDWRP